MWELLTARSKLKSYLLGVLVPVGPELALALVNFARWHLERDCFVRFSSEEDILPSAVRWFDLLFVSGHEPMAGHNALRHFGVVNLKQQRLLANFRVQLLCHAVARTVVGGG